MSSPVERAAAAVSRLLRSAAAACIYLEGRERKQRRTPRRTAIGRRERAARRCGESADAALV